MVLIQISRRYLQGVSPHRCTLAVCLFIYKNWDDIYSRKLEGKVFSTVSTSIVPFLGLFLEGTLHFGFYFVKHKNIMYLHLVY